MAWRIDKQPNGKFARFSDIVDDFTHLNMTEAEALEVCVMECGERTAKQKVKNAVEDIKPWTNLPGSGTDRWEYDIQKVHNVHGAERVHEVYRTAGMCTCGKEILAGEWCCDHFPW